MLSVSRLSVSLGGNDIFSGLDFRLKAGDKVGLIGRNGAGKSTLLRCLAGEIEASEGKIIAKKGLRIGFLRQDMPLAGNTTVLEETLRAFPELLQWESRLRELENLMAGGNTDQAIAEEYEQLQYRFKISGGYDFRGRAKTVLKGLGFKPGDFRKPLNTFSGGWRMRVELAKILSGDNDVLLLDEPTNHLDIGSIVWFEQWLRNYKGIVMLVSHDRRFLDSVTNRTIELYAGGFRDFPLPYSRFIGKKKEIIEKQKRDAKNQEKKIKETERLIERFRYKATKAAFAQSLIKKLEKTERIIVEDDDLKTIKISFPPAKPSGKLVFETENLSKSYGEKRVLDRLSFVIGRGEKIALIGANGQGKTTLASILAGKIPYEGTVRTGHNVRIGYFEQDQSRLLKSEETVLSFLENRADDNMRPFVRDVAGAFLFSGEDVHKPVKVLSGGERNRLVLASLMLQAFNVLILDEPTNHLDIPSKEILKQALMQFDGTVLIVSHDRDFLHGLTNKTFVFEQGRFRIFPGDTDEYLEMIAGRSQEPENREKKKQPDTPRTNERPKDAYKERKKRKNLLRKLEGQIEEAEKRLAGMQWEMSSPGWQPEDGFFEEYDKLQQHLDDLMNRWADLQEE